MVKKRRIRGLYRLTPADCQAIRTAMQTLAWYAPGGTTCIDAVGKYEFAASSVEAIKGLGGILEKSLGVKFKWPKS